MRSESPISDLLLSVHLNGCSLQTARWHPHPATQRHRQHDRNAWLNRPHPRLYSRYWRFVCQEIYMHSLSPFYISRFISILHCSMWGTNIWIQFWNTDADEVNWKSLPKSERCQHDACRNIIFRSHFVYCSLFKCWNRERQRIQNGCCPDCLTMSLLCLMAPCRKPGRQHCTTLYVLLTRPHCTWWISSCRTGKI